MWHYVCSYEKDRINCVIYVGKYNTFAIKAADLQNILENLIFQNISSNTYIIGC